MMHPKPIVVVSPALRKSAEGQGCTLRLPGICNHDCSTVVLCHLPGSHRRDRDDHAVYGCSACHDYIDGRNRAHEPVPLTNTIILDAMLRALAETHGRMIRAGLIAVKGVDPC